MNDKLKDELPSYADMVEMLDILIERVPGSQRHVIENILAALKQAAIIATCETNAEESRAIDELGNILR